MSLPYFDSLDETGKAMALALIEEEIVASGGRAKLEAEYLARLGPPTPPPVDVTTTSKQKLGGIDMKRYELGPAANAEKEAEMTCIVLEYEERRLQNAQLIVKFGTDVNRDYAKRLHAETLRVNDLVEQAKFECDRINFERKTTQEKAGAQISEMMQEWKSLVGRKRVLQREVEKRQASM